MLFIRTTDGHHPAFVMALPSNPDADNGRPQLTFDKVGQQEFLRAVEVPADEGSVLPVTPTEIKAETQAALHQRAARRAVPRS